MNKDFSTFFHSTFSHFKLYYCLWRKIVCSSFFLRLIVAEDKLLLYIIYIKIDPRKC